ncbi:lysozyme inhibitor LprI family protein [Sandaracinobacteroides saxicola]|uniref:DUF1311 domain-containing protein n=1 Tax=Sandaracinobacteroides saxicola TaxID=2759707 RepID=A0A7G5IKB0_9SPHN|nr:lysozyme inhibitor LprI family protein [Sandaracinobacteroides saxicola]QMW23802.1 DUF1311 domain-containing protein [Sandaracinobacteroides saxicola]
MMPRTIATVVLLLAPLPAAAQPANCANAVSQADMTACAAAGRSNADLRLNQSYARLRKGLSAGGQERLKASQRAWIAFRDLECQFRSNGADGGSAAPMVAATCAADLSRARTADLDRLGKCAEGDLSCPR